MLVEQQQQLARNSRVFGHSLALTDPRSQLRAKGDDQSSESRASSCLENIYAKLDIRNEIKSKEWASCTKVVTE